MAKQTGLGDQLFIEGNNIGADVQSIDNLSTPRNTLESTGITQSAMARLFGTRDGQAEFTAYFNPSDNATHDDLKALPRDDVDLMYLRGLGRGRSGLGMVAKQVDYSGTRGDDGAFLFGVTALSNGYGIDWGVQLTDGIQTDAGATNSTGVDLGTGATAFGAQAYVQVFSLGSGSADIKLQSSSDNGAGDAWADIPGAAFTTVTGAGGQRIQTTATESIEEYVRVVTTGTFTNLVFAVLVTRNAATRAI